MGFGKCTLVPAALVGCAEVTADTGQEQEGCAGREGGRKQISCLLGVPFHPMVSFWEGRMGHNLDSRTRGIFISDGSF